MRKFVAVLVLILFSPTIVWGQACTALLAGGIYDTRASSGSFERTTSFAQWFCDQRFGSESEARNFGASVGFPFQGIPVKLGFNSQSQSWQEWYSKICASSRSDESVRTKFREYVQTVNPDIVKAFNQCIGADGLHVWLARSEDPHTFIFNARFNPSSDNESYATIKAFEKSPDDLTCQTPPTGQHVASSGFRTICQRGGDGAVTIVVRADHHPLEGEELSLPRIPRYVPYDSPVVHAGKIRLHSDVLEGRQGRTQMYITSDLWTAVPDTRAVAPGTVSEFSATFCVCSSGKFTPNGNCDIPADEGALAPIARHDPPQDPGTMCGREQPKPELVVNTKYAVCYRLQNLSIQALSNEQTCDYDWSLQAITRKYRVED